MYQSRKIVCALLLVLLLLCQSSVLAFDPSSIINANTAPDDSAKVKVALLYVNNAKTTYDDEINKKMDDNFTQLLKPYTVIPGQRYIELLNKNGISDITTAERSDILEAFKGEDIDYVLYVELQPFIRKERISFFSQGIDMTATIPVKILDIKNNKYLYNGKFTEFASDSTVFGMVGNKSVSMKALDQAIEKMNSVVSVRLPITPSDAK